MNTFVMATQIAPETLFTPDTLEDFEKRVMTCLRSEYPDVQWLHSWAVLGPFDYVDIFEAPDVDAAMKVSALFRTFGRVQTEIWPATEWGHFKELIHTLSEH